MWEFHDKQMRELRRIYEGLSNETQTELKRIIKNFEGVDLNALTTDKTIFNEYVAKWKKEGVLKNEFNVIVLNILNKPAVFNIDMLHTLILGAYYEQETKAERMQKPIIIDDIKYHYREAQEEVAKKTGKEPKTPIEKLFEDIYGSANAEGFMLINYMQYYISKEVIKLEQVLFEELRQGIEIDLDNKKYQKIFKEQVNDKLAIDGDKISGDIDNYVIGFDNEAKVEAYKAEDKEAKVRFIAIEDDRTTPMCHSLDGQEFYVDKDNVYTRYYGIDPKTGYEATMRTHGLVVGENLPPIDNYFHYCRSTIEYI